jgi:hypothetical protein
MQSADYEPMLGTRKKKAPRRVPWLVFNEDQILLQNAVAAFSSCLG